MPTCLLQDRCLIRLSGPDRISFLNGLVTNDVTKITTGHALFAALLSPQGKILFDMLIYPSDDSLLLDVRADKGLELALKLKVYRLRAKVEISDPLTDLQVYAGWDEPMPALACADPRYAPLGWRDIRQGLQPTHQPYHQHRLACAVPEAGLDFSFGDVFPHEANMDLLSGLDFRKGCYIGQEVVSRMHHRGTIRTRTLPVTGDGPLPERGTPILANDRLAGTMGSSEGHRGVAVLRLDRCEEAAASGHPLIAGASHLYTGSLPYGA